MKQHCLTCRREGPSGSLWCQELRCAAGDKPLVMEPGDRLASMAVVRVVTILPGAAIYAAERDGQPILLKVAHAGHEARLEREAQFLMEFARHKSAPPTLPVLQPAYRDASVQSYPFGRAVAGSVTFTYAVFAFVPGESLRDLLRQEPQPWYQHAGWLVLAVADGVAAMHSRGRLHLALSPAAVLVRRDREGIPRPLLLDLGAVTDQETAGNHWQPTMASSAYVPPELLAQRNGRDGQDRRPFGAAADVYGLGLLLYELLAGHPAYDARLRDDTAVLRDVLNTPPPPVARPDLRQIPELAEQAINKEPRRRPPHVVAFARELQAALPALPRERKPRTINWRLVGMVLAAAMGVALLLLMAYTLGGSG